MKQIQFEKFELSPTAYKYYEYHSTHGTVFLEDEDGYYMTIEESEEPAYLGDQLTNVDELFCDFYVTEHEELQLW